MATETNTDKTVKKKKGKRIFVNFLITIIMIAGLGVLLYPTFSDWWNKRRNASLITEYQQVMSQIDDDNYEKIMADARAYNDQHQYNTFIDVFEGEEGYILHHPYDQLLDPTGNHIMGYLEVPKINQKLAIGHGTGDDILEKGIGHVEGTSLPIGGENTHAVLAGHRGLPSAKILSDADQLEIGDKFFLYILDETLAYEIDQIEVVLPDNAEYLQIEPGQDLVTLLTCTPYGVNSHRMLIRGHRIPFEEEDIVEQKRQRRLPEREKPIVLAVAGLIILFIILTVVRLIVAAKDRRKREEEDRALIKDATETARKAAEEAGKAARAAEEAKDAALAARYATERSQQDQAIDRATDASTQAGEASTSAEELADGLEDRINKK